MDFQQHKTMGGKFCYTLNHLIHPATSGMLISLARGTTVLFPQPDADLGMDKKGGYPRPLMEDIHPGRFYMDGYPENGLDGWILHWVNHVTRPLPLIVV